MPAPGRGRFRRRSTPPATGDERTWAAIAEAQRLIDAAYRLPSAPPAPTFDRADPRVAALVAAGWPGAVRPGRMAAARILPAGLVLGLVLAGGFLARPDPPAAPGARVLPAPAAPAILVATGLPGGLRATMPATAREVTARAALAAVCGGRTVAAVVPRATPAPCALVTAERATVRATVLLAPGGGCVTLGAARRLAGRPSAAGVAGLDPVAVRPAGGGSCVPVTGETLTSGRHPLAEQAVVLTKAIRRGDPQVRSVGRVLRAAVSTAPVTEVALRRLPRG